MKKKLQDDQLGNNDHEVKAPEVLTDQQNDIIFIYQQKAGNISKTCTAGNISRPTFYVWYKENSLFKEAIDHIDDEDLDFAEDQLKMLIRGQYVLIPKKDTEGKVILGEFEKDAEGEYLRNWINEPDNGAVFFFLKTKGKKRGYVQRQEITGADGNAIGGFEINIVRKSK